MITLEIVKDIATIVTFLVVTVGLIPIVINLISTSKNLKSKVFLDTLNLLDGKYHEIRGIRHKLDDYLENAEKTGTKFDILSIKKEDRDKFDRLARTFDQVGLLVKHGVIPIDFLFDFYSKPVIKAWTHIRPMFDVKRKKQPGHMLKFEILAIGAALYRKNKYQEEPGFSISNEDTAKWKKWKKWTIRSLKRKQYA